jgi:putative redox protein
MAIEAQLKWTEGLQFIGRADSGPAVVLDNPKNATGASPMEVLLMGVAGCTGMDVVSILQKKRVKLSGFTVNVRGERADGHPAYYTQLDIEFLVYGEDVSPAAVERAIELSKDKYCGAIASLKAPVQTSYQILAADAK